MSDAINDTGAVRVDAALMPADTLGMFREIAQTGQYTDGTYKTMGARLMYPFYGGKTKAAVQVSSATQTGPGIAIVPFAAEVSSGQSAVVIVNNTPDDLTVTRPVRDGGTMLFIPYAPDGTANKIPGQAKVGGVDYFGVGGYLNDRASIFYGSGAVLFLAAGSKGQGTYAVAYGTSYNIGFGLGVKADASLIPDVKSWYGDTGDKTDFAAGHSVTDTSGNYRITASAAPWDTIGKSSAGTVFTVLVEAV